MKTARLEYGDDFVDAEVPDSATVIRPGGAHREPDPPTDPVTATLDAICNPLGMAPRAKQVGHGSTVTIPIPGRVKGGAQRLAPGMIGIPVTSVEDGLREAAKTVGSAPLVVVPELHQACLPQPNFGGGAPR